MFFVTRTAGIRRRSGVTRATLLISNTDKDGFSPIDGSCRLSSVRRLYKAVGRGGENGLRFSEVRTRTRSRSNDGAFHCRALA